MATIGEMLIDINSAKQNIKVAADTSSNDLNTYATAIYAAKDASYNAGYAAGQAGGGGMANIFTVGTEYAPEATINNGDVFAISKTAGGYVCDNLGKSRWLEVGVSGGSVSWIYTTDGQAWTVMGEDDNYFYFTYLYAGYSPAVVCYVDDYKTPSGVYHCTKKTYA